MDFAQRFDAMMLLTQTSNYSLAKEIGVSDSLISTWRSGTKKPTMENIKKISKFFQVSSDYLLCLSDEKEPQMRPIKNEAEAFMMDKDEKANIEHHMDLMVPGITEEERELVRSSYNTSGIERCKQAISILCLRLDRIGKTLNDERDAMSRSELLKWERLHDTNIKELGRWDNLLRKEERAAAQLEPVKKSDQDTRIELLEKQVGTILQTLSEIRVDFEQDAENERQSNGAIDPTGSGDQ